MDLKFFVTAETDALPLEYKLNEWRSLRHLDVNDIMNNASVSCVVCANEGGSRAPGRGAEPCPDMRAICPVIAHKLFGNSGPGDLTVAQWRQVQNFARDVLKALRSVPHAST